MKRRGLALIVVIGILGVLAVLAAAFVMMAQLERRASEQRVNAARAYLLARSGIEDALARLDLGQDPSYGGENWDGSSDGLLSGFEADQEVYHRTGAGTTADIDACPVRHAMRPSFFARLSAVNRDPALVKAEDRNRGYSGKLIGDYADRGNTYALKAGAEGSEGQGFYINGGDPSVHSEPTAVSDCNTNLRRMLGILAKAITEGVGDAVGGLTGLALTEADGWNLVDARPKTGWKDWEQVRTLALGGGPGSAGDLASQAKLALIKPYLTLHAWTDKKVIVPNVTPSILDPNGTTRNPATDAEEPAKIYHAWGEFKLDHPPTSSASRAPDFERIPVKNGKIVGRAPVDLAWARHKRPALVALLGGLKGLYLDESAAMPIFKGDTFAALRAAELTLDWDVGADICHKVATWIQASTSDLFTWQQWRGFCDALPDAVVMSPSDYALFLAYSTADSALSININPTNQTPIPSYVSLGPAALHYWCKGQAVRDILKANFNPNSNLNKFSPNLSMWKLVDKQDLLVHSTEFSLLPVPYGHQEVSSVGRIMDSQGSLLAKRLLQVRLLLSSPARLTTQKEFLCNDLGSLDIAGDETGIRLPGATPVPFITLSQGLSRTWGHALPGLGGQGLSLQIYPEPVVDVKGDGTGPPRLEELGNSLLHVAKPGTLYPDGGYSEQNRAPEYLDKGNADGFHGVMSLWVKANHVPPMMALRRGLGFGRGHPIVKWTNLGTRVSDNPQFFFWGDQGDDAITPLVCQFEIGHATGDVGNEHRVGVGRHLIPHRWELLTLKWDFLNLGSSSYFMMEMDIGSGLGVSDRGGMREKYTSNTINYPTMASDITADDLQLDGSIGPHRIALGRGHPEREGDGVATYTGYIGSGADATFDEFALYDFGGAPSSNQQGTLITDSLATRESPSILASRRYPEGRYYKESAYLGLGAPGNAAAEWFSAPIFLGDVAVRIRGLSWTQIVPWDLPEGAVSFELVDGAGAAYALDTGGHPLGQRLTNGAWSPVDRVVSGAFRLHAVFQPNLDEAEKENTPILDPLALDDVTIVYEPLGGPRIIAWGSEED